MNNTIKTAGDQPAPETLPREKRKNTESNFELVILAAQRSKQLVNGARPRVASDNKRNPKNTRIAIREVELGLIDFKGNYED